MSEGKVGFKGAVHFQVIRARPTWRTRILDAIWRAKQWLHSR